MNDEGAIPGLLAAGSRTVVTGPAGIGKTALLGQLAMSAAAGIHPFTGQRFAPRRVMLVDGEDHHNLVARRILRLSGAADAHGAPAQPGQLTICTLRLDLAQRADRDGLRATFSAVEPDLLCIGPYWRFHGQAETPGGAECVTSLLDEFVSAGCAVVVEAHDPPPLALCDWAGTGLTLHAAVGPDAHSGVVSAVEVVPWWVDDVGRFPEVLTRGDQGDWPWIATGLTEGEVA